MYFCLMLNIDLLVDYYNNSIEASFKKEISFLRKEKSDFFEYYTNEISSVFSLVIRAESTHYYRTYIKYGYVFLNRLFDNDKSKRNINLLNFLTKKYIGDYIIIL